MKNILKNVIASIKLHKLASCMVGGAMIFAMAATPICIHLIRKKETSSPPVFYAEILPENEENEPADQAEEPVQEEVADPKVEETPQTPVENNDISYEDTSPSFEYEGSVENNVQDRHTNSESSSENKTDAVTPPIVTAEKFSKEINVYDCSNVETASGSDDYIARMSVYCIDDNSSNKTDFKEKFKTSFGFYPTAEIQSQYIGEFLVDGYDGTQKIYQYIIEDCTYPLITDEFYVVKKKICADGSAWVGFPIPCSMDNMDTSQKVQDLLTKMNQTFYEWYDIDYSYAITNRDKFHVDMISEAGLMRTEDGQVLDVIYRYSRGVNMPVQ